LCEEGIQKTEGSIITKATELIKPFSLTAAYANKLRRAKESQSSQRNKI
jgi:hypothetical protein